MTATGDMAAQDLVTGGAAAQDRGTPLGASTGGWATTAPATPMAAPRTASLVVGGLGALVAGVLLCVVAALTAEARYLSGDPTSDNVGWIVLGALSALAGLVTFLNGLHTTLTRRDAVYDLLMQRLQAQAGAPEGAGPATLTVTPPAGTAGP